jgi:hypothetical protein
LFKVGKHVGSGFQRNFIRLIAKRGYSDPGEDLADQPSLCFGASRAVRNYHIPDFSNWKNHDAFEVAFARLEKDLRMSIGK